MQSSLKSVTTDLHACVCIQSMQMMFSQKSGWAWFLLVVIPALKTTEKQRNAYKQCGRSLTECIVLLFKIVFKHQTSAKHHLIICVEAYMK